MAVEVHADKRNTKIGELADLAEMFSAAGWMEHVGQGLGTGPDDRVKLSRLGRERVLVLVLVVVVVMKVVVGWSRK